MQPIEQENKSPHLIDLSFSKLQGIQALKKSHQKNPLKFCKKLRPKKTDWAVEFYKKWKNQAKSYPQFQIYLDKKHFVDWEVKKKPTTQSENLLKSFVDEEKTILWRQTNPQGFFFEKLATKKL